MRTRTKWTPVLAVITAIGVAACTGDQAGDGAEDGAATDTMQTQQPADQTGATDATGGQQVTGPVPEGATQAMVTQGQEIFTGQGLCFTCHGMNGEGTNLGPNQTDEEWINIEGTYASIQDVVRNGVPEPIEHPGPMPPMGGAQLSDEQIQAVSAYVYALSHGN